jgi:hypothetical protein
MTTVRQIQRLWTSRQHTRLFRDLLAMRPERALRLEMELDRPAPAAALAMIRLEELDQSHVPFYGELLRFVLRAQEADGGWGDPMATALCLRALMCDRGQGHAIDQGLLYLANLQKPEGIWPNVPIRRMPADPYVSAFVLYQLGQSARFRSAVRFFDAINWFQTHERTLDSQTRCLWDRAALRCRVPETRQPDEQPMLIWS